MQVVVVIAIEHFDERPLRPLVICRVASAYLAVPIVAETYLVELFAVTVDIFLGCHLGMLPRLYGILLGRQAVCVIPHGVQHIKAVQAFVTRINVRSYVAQRMPNVQPRPRRVWEHIEHIKLRSRVIDFGFISIVFFPILLPALFYFLEIIFHYNMCFLFYFDNSSILFMGLTALAATSGSTSTKGNSYLSELYSFSSVTNFI